MNTRQEIAICLFPLGGFLFGLYVGSRGLTVFNGADVFLAIIGLGIGTLAGMFAVPMLADENEDDEDEYP